MAPTETQDLRLFSLKDFCERAGNMSQWTARALIRQGSLRAVKLGTRVAIPASELARLAEEGCASRRSGEK